MNKKKIIKKDKNSKRIIKNNKEQSFDDNIEMKDNDSNINLDEELFIEQLKEDNYVKEGEELYEKVRKYLEEEIAIQNPENVNKIPPSPPPLTELDILQLEYKKRIYEEPSNSEISISHSQSLSDIEKQENERTEDKTSNNKIKRIKCIYIILTVKYEVKEKVIYDVPIGIETWNNNGIESFSKNNSEIVDNSIISQKSSSFSSDSNYSVKEHNYMSNSIDNENIPSTEQPNELFYNQENIEEEKIEFISNSNSQNSILSLSNKNVEETKEIKQNTNSINIPSFYQRLCEKLEEKKRRKEEEERIKLSLKPFSVYVKNSTEESKDNNLDDLSNELPLSNSSNNNKNEKKETKSELNMLIINKIDIPPEKAVINKKNIEEELFTPCECPIVLPKEKHILCEQDPNFILDYRPKLIEQENESLYNSSTSSSTSSSSSSSYYSSSSSYTSSSVYIFNL